MIVFPSHPTDLHVHFFDNFFLPYPLYLLILCTPITVGLHDDGLGSCSASTSIPIAEAICVGKHDCNVQTSDKLFGDPCYGEYGTSEYLVPYE